MRALSNKTAFLRGGQLLGTSDTTNQNENRATPHPSWTVEHWTALAQLNHKARHDLQLSHPLSKPPGQWISGSRSSCARVSGPPRSGSPDPAHGPTEGLPRFPRMVGIGRGFPRDPSI